MNPIIAPELHSHSQDEILQAIRREVKGRHAAAINAAGFWRRLVIRIQIEREARHELKRRFPPDALYATRVT